jgi:dolichol-phosphate mannosyltransferase
MKSLVIVPTYNEAENIVPIIKAIHDAVPALSVLVVDDGSPDGTAALVQQLIESGDQRVYLMKRHGKQGLRAAYVAGFKWGLERGFSELIEMDADFSHDPQILPTILEKLKEYDVVIGSRYIPGGGTSNWSRFRKMISQAGSLYARTILGLPFRDLTGGFNGWRSATLKGIDLDSLQSDGYAFQIELKYRSHRRGFKIVETPIVFAERRAGASKMSGGIFIEAIHRVWRIRQYR